MQIEIVKAVVSAPQNQSLQDLFREIQKNFNEYSKDAATPYSFEKSDSLKLFFHKTSQPNTGTLASFEPTLYHPYKNIELTHKVFKLITAYKAEITRRASLSRGSLMGQSHPSSTSSLKSDSSSSSSSSSSHSYGSSSSSSL